MLRVGSKASEKRRHLSESLSWQQDQALSSSIYLLRQIGPTGFLLREEEPENGDFRVTTTLPVSLGDWGMGSGRREGGGGAGEVPQAQVPSSCKQTSLTSGIIPRSAPQT